MRDPKTGKGLCKYKFSALCGVKNDSRYIFHYSFSSCEAKLDKKAKSQNDEKYRRHVLLCSKKVIIFCYVVSHRHFASVAHVNDRIPEQPGEGQGAMLKRNDISVEIRNVNGTKSK